MEASIEHDEREVLERLLRNVRRATANQRDFEWREGLTWEQRGHIGWHGSAFFLNKVSREPRPSSVASDESREPGGRQLDHGGFQPLVEAGQDKDAEDDDYAPGHLAAFARAQKPIASPLHGFVTAIIQLTVPDGWANFHLPWAAMALTILTYGRGRISLDHAVAHRFRPGPSP